VAANVGSIVIAIMYGHDNPPWVMHLSYEVSPRSPRCVD
jgi:hypothetical protein